MKCYTCGNIYSEHEGTLELHNKSIGSYNIYLAKYYKCSGCGALLFPKETAKKIESKEEEIRNNLIRKLPIGEFITATEAFDILEISKQAFHKHRRIKNGFIYSAILGGKRLYNKKSVQLFKETKDGRFNLSEPVDKEVVKYIQTILVPIRESTIYEVLSFDSIIGSIKTKYAQVIAGVN
ncbi:MAG: hypothetical protein H8E80_02845 [Desulfobacteraceae bacterium]|uniref:Helix-turn-helix domain protein n=1 Tax=Candidatus Desulfaltia bathyphila TaxID=2841697 RepID=A0A8J6TBD5_9BACT|nr:hypothetical protein [Candidatus Desulfaltia bathyphila]MBL7195418.1 hypothetical protein [Desulfobacterales bacterium]